MIICKDCDKKLKSEKALKAHMWRAHTKSGIEYSKNKAGRQSKPNHRKGLTKETSEEIRKISEKVSITMKQKIKNGYKPFPPMKEDQRLKLSVSQSLKNRGREMQMV